mgnify:CR=1 FL=1
MARSSVSTKKTFTDDFAKELEEALELETAALAAESGDLDIAASMEELEAQIAMAAEELAREGQQDRSEDEAAESPAVSSVEAPAALADAEASAAAEKDGPHLAEPPLAETEPSRFDKTGRDGNLHRVETAPSSSSVLLPANDDRQGEYHVFAGKLEQRPPNTIYWIAAVLSVAWIVGGLGVAHLLYGTQIWQASSLGGLLTAPGAVGVALGIILPVLLFWGFAVMIRRAQEMRLAARHMTEAAFRLIEPENIARDRIMMVGQAVRREVQAMGEGIERTLARAIELETLVQTEVNELERAYSENESRIRLLVDSLGSEREGIISHAERVRASITDAHALLKVELAAAGDQIRSSVDAAAQKLAESLSKSGEDIVSRIGSKGEALQESFLAKASAFSDELSNSTGEIANLLDSRFSNLSETVSGFLNRIEGVSDTLTGAMTETGEKLVSRLASTGSNLTELLESRLADIGENADSFLARLDATANELARSFQDKTSSLAENLKTSGEAVAALLDSRIETVSERTERFLSNVDSATGSVTEALDRKAAALEQRIAASGADVANLLESSLSSFDETTDGFVRRIESSVSTVSAILDDRTDAVEKQLVATAENVSGILRDSLSSLDSQAEQLASRIETAAESVTTTLDQRTVAIEKRLATSGMGLARALEAGLLINVTRERVIRLLPPLILSRAEADTLIGILCPLVKRFLAEA